MATGDVFVRKASGLVRNLSAFDALNVNVAMCSPLQGVLWAWTFGPFMFQQVNLVLAYFLGMIVVGIGAALTYTLWTIGMPRSGGDYIWFSRTVHPAYGFVINWFLTFVFLNWFAMNSATFGPFFIGSVFVSLGMNEAAATVSSYHRSRTHRHSRRHTVCIANIGWNEDLCMVLQDSLLGNDRWLRALRRNLLDNSERSFH